MPGPLRLDVDQEGKIEGLSLKRYQLALKPFCQFLSDFAFEPDGIAMWDDLLVEYKNYENIRKYDFELLVAALEFFFPSLKVRWPGHGAYFVAGLSNTRFITQFLWEKRLRL